MNKILLTLLSLAIAAGAMAGTPKKEKKPKVEVKPVAAKPETKPIQKPTK